ncbi:MAG: restriction endonuclease subunit S [Gemmataceae bacterium]
MIDGLKPYPKYKDSGLPWLCNVPSHWSRERGKRLFTRMERPVRPGDEIVTCFRDGMVTLRKNRRLRGFTEAIYELGYQGIRKGDLVIHAMDAFAGAMGVSDSDGKCTPEYLVCIPHSPAISPRYYAAVLRYIAFQGFILVSCPAVRERAPRFRFPNFGDMRFPVPTHDEQAAIVRFLDHANGKIERAIRAKRKLIALLNEQKQAIIHRAVTRGLDPNVKLKPSGIPWLGDVPEHWEIRRLKFLAHIKTGGRDTVHRRDDGAYPFFVRSQTVERINTYSFDGEAVLTAGDGAGVAKVFHYVNGKFDYHQRVYKFSNFKEISGRFFFHYFSDTLRFEAFRETAKSTVDSLRLPMLQDFPGVLPPSNEQLKLIEFIERETATLRVAISRAEREIELLREYRTTLTADVVTGKLDVREAVKGLLAEDEEPSPVEDEGEDIEESDTTEAEE